MLRTDGPAERGDSKETSIAFVDPVTEARGAREGRLIIMFGLWRER